MGACGNARNNGWAQYGWIRRSTAGYGGAERRMAGHGGARRATAFHKTKHPPCSQDAPWSLPKCSLVAPTTLHGRHTCGE